MFSRRFKSISLSLLGFNIDIEYNSVFNVVAVASALLFYSNDVDKSVTVERMLNFCFDFGSYVVHYGAMTFKIGKTILRKSLTGEIVLLFWHLLLYLLELFSSQNDMQKYYFVTINYMVSLFIFSLRIYHLKYVIINFCLILS